VPGADPSTATSPPAPRRKRVRWPIRLFKALVALAVVFVLVCLWAWRYRNDEYLARFIMEKNSTNRGRIVLGRVHWGWRAFVDLAWGQPTPVTIDRFVVLDPQGEETIHIERVEGNVELLPLVTTGNLTVHALRVPRGGRVRVIEKRASGGGTELSLLAAFQPQKPSGKRGIRIKLAFDFEEVDLKIQRHDWTLQMLHARSQGSFMVTGGPPSVEGVHYDLRLHAPEGRLVVRGFEVPLRNLRAQRWVVSTEHPMDLHLEVTSEAGDARVRLDGALLGIYRPHARVDVKASAWNGQSLLARVLGPGAAGPGRLRARIRGPLEGPTIEGRVFDVELGSPPLRATGLTGQVLLDPLRRRIGAEAVSGRFLGGHVGGKAGLNLQNGNWSARAEVQGLEPGRVAPPLAGLLTGKVALRGTTRPLLTARAEMDLQLARPRRDLLPDRLRIGGNVHLGATILDLAGVTLTGEGNRLTARGSINIPSRRVNLSTVLDGHDVAGWLARRGLPAAVRSGRAEIQLTGRWPALRASGTVQARSVGHGPFRLREVSGHAELVDGTLRVSRVAAEGYGGKLSGEATLELFDRMVTRPRARPTLQTRIRADGLDLTALGARQYAIGRLFAEVELSGPLGELEGTASVRLPRAALMGEQYHGSSARLGILRDRLTIYESRLERADGGRVELWGDLHYTRRLDLRLRARAFPLGAVPGAGELPVAIGGILDGTVVVKGPPDDPRLSGRLAIAGARVRGAALGSGEINLSPGSDGVRVAGRLAGDLIKLDGYLLPKPLPRMFLSVDVSRFPLEKLLHELRRLGDVRSTVSGRVQLAADVRSGLTSASARLSRAALVLHYRPRGERRDRTVTLENDGEELAAHYDGKLLRLSSVRLVTRVSGETRRAARAAVGVGGWLGASGMDLYIRGRLAAELAEFFLARQVRKLGGSALADVRLRGGYARPTLDGTLRLERISLSMPKLERPIEIPEGRVRLAPGKLRLDGVRLQMERSRLALAGEVTLERLRPTASDLAIAGDVNLRLLQLFFPAQVSNAAGTAIADMRISGPIADPQLKGTVALRHVEVTPRGWGRTITFERGKVAFSNYLVKITQTLEGTYDEGLLRIAGEVRLNRWDLADVYLKIVGTGIPQRQPQVYSTESNLNLTLYGDSSQLTLKGDIDLVDARYIRSFDIVKQAFIRPRTHEEETPFWKGNPLLENLKLELNLQSRGQLAVKNNYATLSLSGALTVGGTLSDARLGGQIRVDEGSFRIPFLRGDYTINRGEITFDSKKTTDDAEINITGETLFVDRVSGTDYQIKLHLLGPLSRIGIQLSSVPALDQGQIIALLAFGRTTDQLRSQLKGAGDAGGGGAAGAADAQVKQLTSEALAEMIEDPLKKVTRLDVFRLEVGTESTRIRACKKLGRYVDLCGDYDQGYLGDSRAEGRMEVKMHDLLMLVGKWERLSTRLETESIDPLRGRAEMRFRLPIR
jgi:hypothetical protein